METFTFNIPSTCTEVIEVKANSAVEAAQVIIDGGEYEYYIPESEFNIRMTQEEIMSCLQ